MSRSDRETRGSDADAGPPAVSFEDVRWTTCSLEDFVNLYWERVAPALAADGLDPRTDRPTHAWFEARGARSFLAALRRHHDRSFGEFWSADLGLGDDGDDYPWATTDEETIESLQRFLDRRRARYDLADSSVDALRTRLNLYVRAYRAANDADDLVTPVDRANDAAEYEAVDACYAAFDWLNESTDPSYSPRTLRRVRRVVDGWYQHLVGRRVASFNPASGLYEEFKWDPGDSATPALAADHVRSLVEAAADPRERLLVTALAGWGLRASEVAALHVSQFELDVPDDDVPHVAFDQRKNGPGEVSLLFGTGIFEARVDELAAEDSWTGYLFPSSQGQTPHVTRETVRNWFQDLASRAGLPARVRGERPSPQLCRRFWYDTYSAALEGVLEGVEDIAAEQGSTDPGVVMRNYLSSSRARSLRREAMRARLASVFE